MTFLPNIAPLGLVLVALAALVLLFNRASGWRRVSKLFGVPPVPTVYWARYATCIVGLGRFPTSIGACERGLVIKPLFPLSLVTPTLWAPWDEIQLEGPRWFWGTYEDIAIRGFHIALPASIGDRIRGAQRGWKRFDEPV
jgi:hypothetical protein